MVSLLLGELLQAGQDLALAVGACPHLDDSVGIEQALGRNQRHLLGGVGIALERGPVEGLVHR